MVDVIMTSSKMSFYCIRGEKADNIPDNNFNKFKHTFIIFSKQYLEEKKTMCNC